MRKVELPVWPRRLFVAAGLALATVGTVCVFGPSNMHSELWTAFSYESPVWSLVGLMWLVVAYRRAGCR
jgi:hypothetical protein